MKIEIEIPKEFQVDYNADKFEDFFMRVSYDIEAKMNGYSDGICGNYEKETAEMFAKALEGFFNWLKA